MRRIVRKAAGRHLSASDIRMLIATWPIARGLARRKQIRPCRPWIRFYLLPAPHSASPACTPIAGSSD
ncbi:MAG: protein GbcA [Gammaproteobacteria bacterium HGW-Gammaproteobacteria-12]|nr:MAG: protein GbcA [Gammaproteobacteria bacterium HGW-Gammaproteobacteria-12]